MSGSHFKNGERAACELGTLLRNLPTQRQLDAGMSDDERGMVSAASSHARIAVNTLIDGMESLGELLFLASGNEDYALAPNHLANIGCLIKHMAVEVEFALEQRGDLEFTLVEDAKRVAAASSTKKGAAK